MDLLRLFEGSFEEGDRALKLPVERMNVTEEGLMPGQRKLESDVARMLDGCLQYRRRQIRVAAKQMSASAMIAEYTKIESILLREGLRPLKDSECSVKMAAMGEGIPEEFDMEFQEQ